MEKVVDDQADMGIPDMQDGISYRMSRVREVFVGDGMSNTYLLGEKYVDAGLYDLGSDDGDSMPMMVGYSSDNVRWGVDAPQQDARRQSHAAVFGSGHRGGWNVAYADGAVRTVSFDIDVDIHRALSTRDGGSRSETPARPQN